MPRKMRVLASVAAISIILLPWSGEWPCRTARALLTSVAPSAPAKYWYLPCDALSKAIRYLRTHRSRFSNRRFISIIDFTEPSTSKRLFVINMKSEKVQRFLVSHGKNSGKLFAIRFSNRPQSYESPIGFFLTGREYKGDHGPSLVLYGLQKGINDNTAYRKIVMHGAPYVSPGAIVLNQEQRGLAMLGRSLGCPAIPVRAAKEVIDRIKGGSLLYMYAGRH